MDRLDIALGLPGSDGDGVLVEVSASGDVKLAAGADSYRRWVVRFVTTSVGELLHRSGWGGGLEEALGRPLASSADVVARIRRGILADERTKDVRVSLRRDAARGLDVLDIDAVTVDDVTVSETIPVR